MVGGIEVSEPGANLAERNLFVDDACLQYLHCTDDNQQSETVWLSAVNNAFIQKSLTTGQPTSVLLCPCKLELLYSDESRT